MKSGTAEQASQTAAGAEPHGKETGRIRLFTELRNIAESSIYR